MSWSRVWYLLCERVSNVISHNYDERWQMSVFRTNLDEYGGIVIPEEYLQVLGLRAGDEVVVRLEDSEVCIFSVEHAIMGGQDAYLWM